jgi:outer membrane protein assembly factor BamE (lipoprotein component of BamABCDE complex)
MRTASRLVAALAAIALLVAAPAFGRGYIGNPALLDRIKPGVTTAQEVVQLLGPPANRTSFPRQGVDSLDYVMQVWTETFDVGIIIGKDGVVREVQRLERFIQRG